jgi:hypothetical protein
LWTLRRKFKDRGGGGDGRPEWIMYAWIMLGHPAYLPDYKTGLKRSGDAPEIYVPSPLIEPVPVFGPGRAPLRVPFRIPIVVP